MLFNVELGRFIQVLGDVFAVFLALAYAFRQQVFDLPVDGAEIILCPGSDLGIKRFRNAQRDLFFFCHC